MNCHQILSGACNSGDRCFAIGSVEGVPFTAYAAGCNIVILASTFERVQIIPGAIHNYIRISALDCSTDTGKIAAAFEDTICIFEPTPLLHNSEAPPTHGLEYKWVQTGTLQASSHISSLSWNLEGTRLLTGGTFLQLWHQNINSEQDDEPANVTFEIGGEDRVKSPTDIENQPDDTWECVWKCQTASPIHHMAFSPDGTLFATSGKSDRLVKVWYENKHLLFPSRSLDHSQSINSSFIQELNYGFVYVAHPRAVTHISWRKTSKYMPKGSVSNMLVTSCLDNICRIWVETVLPEDGLVNMNQFDPLASQNPKFRTHRHKHRFMQRLKHMKACFHIRRHAKNSIGTELIGSKFGNFNLNEFGSAPIPTLPSTYSVHDFHSYGYHGTGVTPGLHFHLAASINAETDIPLVPSMQTNDPASQPNFILHWLNNKEMHFSMQAEQILQDMAKKVIEKEDLTNLVSGDDNTQNSDGYQNEDGSVGMGANSDETRKRLTKMNKSFSHDESQSCGDEPHNLHQYQQGIQQNTNRSQSIGTGSQHGVEKSSHQTMSNTTSINSLATDGGGNVGFVTGNAQTESQQIDSLDMKIECLLRDWHHSPDLLFSIHPIDGSFLIWVIEWLDEYHPGAFRQATVSFSTRIPNAFPLGDAMSMSTTVSLYSTGISVFNFREMVLKSVRSNAQLNTKLQTKKEEAREESDTGVLLPSVKEEQDADGDETADKVEHHQKKKAEKANSNGTNVSDSKSGNMHQLSQDLLLAPPAPVVSMVTKHSNGSLNLWQLTFSDKSKFSQVLSIQHTSRASGHRFRVNDISCHPVLPLLLSTSHHNTAEVMQLSNADTQKFATDKLKPGKDVCVPVGFCSELILWRVDAVGPLSQSGGGVSELARINSPEISAFSNVAWVPTLLPSTTLGSLSNSPSACFVASDGESLRVYQAVIDARTLLAEISSSERRHRMMDSMMSLSDCSSINESTMHRNQPPLHDKIKIVSQQSTARPGCIIQLDAIADATHDWQNTQFLHVFQEQLITGVRSENNQQQDDMNRSTGPFNMRFPSESMDPQMDAIVDLQQSSVFEEPFYIVLLEKTGTGTILHMWRIVIASQPVTSDDMSGSMMYVPDSNIVQDLEESELARQSTSDILDDQLKVPLAGVHVNDTSPPRVNITTTKVCTQDLPLPEGVDIVHAAPAAGHLSSSSIYPACFAPYIIVTACSDSTVRFWKCKVTNAKDKKLAKFEWCEWEMIRRDQKSCIEVNGQLLHISAAYSGRIACAYKYGKSFTRPTKADPETRYVNMCVAIYECESTGGSEWILEDTIHLKNIHLPQIKMDPHLDLGYLYDHQYLAKKQRLTQVLHPFNHDDLIKSPIRPNLNNEEVKNGPGLLAVPSFSTLQSLRKSITEHGNNCPLTQKHLVQLDWVSKEDGSHILTVAVSSKIMLFTPVSSDLAQANMKAMKESRTTNRPLLRKASSLVQPHFNDEIRWMKLRQILLHTADGLPPLPMQISWVRDGIFVVGMDSEMHVYSQWKAKNYEQLFSNQLENMEDVYDTRCLRDEDLRPLMNDSSQRRMPNVASMPIMSRISANNLQLYGQEKKKKNMSSNQIQSIQPDVERRVNYDYMTDYGLFEASRIACPVLPQYHPKQLMELLNSGKIRWVKAILAHLVRCISGTYSMRSNDNDEESLNRQQRGWSRSRTLSVSYAAGTNSPLEPRGSTTQIPEELTLDYAEITSIPPLPLWTLLAADKERLEQKEEVKDYNQLFESEMNDESLDDLLEEDGAESPRRKDRRSSIPERQYLSHFGPRQGQLLSRLLTHTHLPGLSSLDQMHLLALADTVSTCNTDFAERFAIDAAKTAIAKENLTGVPSDSEHISTDSLDDCGLRFLLAMKHYSYLLRCLPLSQRSHFQKQGVGTSNIVWAFHSESEEELLNLIPNYGKGEIKWSTLKEVGVGFWLKSHILLKQCFERLAKAAYQMKQDPLDAALYYIAMKKKSVVWGLFRNRRDEKMTQFFSNNFAEDRWRKAALKNAFALLGKQRFEHAVAFFLLANALNDAIEVCLTKLEDIQLALLITRLYEGEHDSTPPSYKKLLYEEILGCDKNGENYDIDRAHPDPFLRSMALWILKDYSGSLSTLLQNNVGILHKAYDDEDPKQHGFQNSNNQSSAIANPNVFNFYVYLRTHPLLIRQHIASTALEKKRTQVVLSGFSFGGGSANENTNSKVKPYNLTTDKQLHLEDSITPLERQLYFTTAHCHFKAGCPALALEVLSKLPAKVIETDHEDETSSLATESIKTDHAKIIETGTFDWGEPASTQLAQSDQFDWGAPVSGGLQDDGFKIEWDEDGNNEDEDPDDDDGGGLGMKIDQINDTKEIENNANDSDTQNQYGQFDIMAQQLKFIACLKILMEELSTLATGFEVDGGQLRYQLYIWLEREVDALKYLCNYSGGDASNNTIGDDSDNNQNDPHQSSAKTSSHSDRPTLHEILMQEKLDFEAKVQRAAKRKRWLKSNETLLRTLLSYCSLHGASGGGLASVRMELVLLLQELQQEKTQQQLLSPLPFPTTLPLLSACVAGNKTVIADPIKYLQQHTHDMLQTIIDLPGPPIGLRDPHSSEIFVMRDLAVALSACIYQSLCDSDTFSIKQLTTTDGCSSPGMETIAKLNASCQSTHLMANAANIHRRRKFSMDEPVTVSTTPSKWPGVTNLRALLARDKDEDTPRLNVLLCEAFISTYMSLLVYALSSCDCHILYRLSGQNFTDNTWAMLFGGGIKKLLRKATSQMPPVQPILQTPQQTVTTTNGVTTTDGNTDNSMWNTVTSITKQRVKLNMKILGQFGTQNQNTTTMKEDKPTYREQFVPPEMSMVSYFLTKPIIGGDPSEDDYDSADSAVSDLDDIDEDDEDVFADPLSNDVKAMQQAAAVKKYRKENTEHTNSNSFSWCIMRCSIIKVAYNQIQAFINTAGLELQELPVTSPLIHGILRVLTIWQDLLRTELETRGPASADYIPGCFIEDDVKGPSILKYRSLLEKRNTPFSPNAASAAPARRLWNYLIRQEICQDTFIRAIFGKRKSFMFDTLKSNSNTAGTQGMSISNSATDVSMQNASNADNVSGGPAKTKEPIEVFDPVRIIHKDQESISAFCVNLMNTGMLAVATPREVQEMDISLLLESPNWLEDECEFDILNLSKDVDGVPSSGFLVIQAVDTKNPTNQSANMNQQQNYPTSSNTNPSTGVASQSGRGTSVIKGATFPGSHCPRYCKFIIDRSKHFLKPVLKHKVDNIKRMSSHPLMPLYLTGGQDGSVQMWEWGHQQAVCTPRPPGTFAKVTRCRFSQHGNKFGIADGDGKLSLWQVGLATQCNRSFFTYECHNKIITDFMFLGSCSLVATAGHSAENKNVAIWDTLLPQKKSMVSSFTCHDQGASSIVFAPQHQLLISAGKKGDVCIFDTRQRTLRHRFQAHDHAIKCLAIDPQEEIFATGSADGDIKIWNLAVNTLLYSYPGEHKHSSFFKHIGQGVTQIYIDQMGRMFSCGADGSMKIRQLPNRDPIVNSIY